MFRIFTSTVLASVFPSSVLACSALSVALIGLTLPVQAQRQRQAPQIYVDSCLSCHGSTGGNGTAQSLLDDIWLIDGSDEALTKIIKEGVPDGGMPGYGETLSDREIRTLIVYMQELRSHHERGGDTGGSVSDNDRYASQYHDFEVEELVSGLRVPWSMEFLPNGDWLVAERPGQLRLVRNGKLHAKPIEGTPEVFAQGQGGLLEVKLHPDYRRNRWVYLAYSDPKQINGQTRSMTAIVRGKIRNHRWVDEEVIYKADDRHYMPTRFHFGTRIAFDENNYLFFPIGDRGRQNTAQDPSNPNGNMHRVHDDGRIPSDNPFINNPDHPDALPTVWSYGHRNPQGIDFHPETGELYAAEHGPRGGDELNLVERGNNYGWPVITYGINYNGTPITDKTHMPGMEQPVTQWTPSIAVIGIDFYHGNRFPEWKNDLFVSAIASGNLRRLRVDGNELIEDELLFNDQGRLRDVNMGPDGLIYVLTNEGRILRLLPRR